MAETKKRVELYMPIEMDEFLKKLATEKSESDKKKISKNKMILIAIEAFYKAGVNA